nr:hypothetical protein [uncultured Bacteroides sp.]
MMQRAFFLLVRAGLWDTPADTSMLSARRCFLSLTIRCWRWSTRLRV